MERGFAFLLTVAPSGSAPDRAFFPENNQIIPGWKRMRWFGLVLLLALAACDEPRSAAYSPERGNNFEPVAVELQSAQMAQKIDGIATLVSPDSLTLLNAEIRAAEIASGFSQRSLDRFKGVRTLGEQRVDNAERQASTDATQVALLKLRMRNAWGDTAPFLAAANRHQLVDELASGKTTIVRLDFPRSVDRESAQRAHHPTWRRR